MTETGAVIKSLNAKVPHPPTPDGGSKVILVVDDDEAMTSMLCTFLLHLGYSPTPVTDSREVMGWIKEHVCDIVILDLEMPDLAGMKLLGMIKDFNPQLPVIVYTGYGYEDAKMRQALKLGAAGYVSKNVQVDEFLSALQRVLLAKP